METGKHNKMGVSIVRDDVWTLIHFCLHNIQLYMPIIYSNVQSDFAANQMSLLAICQIC